MNKITIWNSWYYRWSTLVDSWYKLSSKHGVMLEIQSQAWTEEPIIKSWHHLQWWKEPSWSHNPQSDTASEEHLKIVFRILTTFTKLLPYSLFVITHFMSSWRPTASQYTHQQVVTTFRELIQYSNERGSTHIFCMVSHSANIEGVW